MTPAVLPTLSSSLKPQTAPAVGASSVSSFTSLPTPSLPQPGALAVVPRPAPDVEVPGVGRLTAAQAQQVLETARSAVRQLQSYAQFHHAGVTAEALAQISDAGAIKELKELGYVPPADAVQMRAEIGALLDWARAPFQLSGSTPG